MVANINNFGVINFYENSNSKSDSSKKSEPICQDVTPAEDLSSNSSESDSGSPILSIPEKNKYSQVRIYIRERCRFDEEFKKFCQERSLRDLCARLTDEFGWFVDEHSLGANLNRNR